MTERITKPPHPFCPPTAIITKDETEDIIRNWKGLDFSWRSLCTNYIIPEILYKHFPNRIVWNVVCQNQRLSEEIILTYRNSLDWNLVCKHQNLTPKIYDTCAKFINWKIVCEHQLLTDDLIMQYIDFIDFGIIAKYQKISDRVALLFWMTKAGWVRCISEPFELAKGQKYTSPL